MAFIYEERRKAWYHDKDNKFYKNFDFIFSDQNLLYSYFFSGMVSPVELMEYSTLVDTLK